ncbi:MULTISPECIES: peptidylprolyl isomerase [unclassified Saccharibacter]|uniref:peptidylprolyl isomerase n=1 Tax=unclassified Saccharibacter TaxID=2648722 RepID=UPI00132AF160|nr:MULTISPECIES: peptidylprolyl isomerase [unclassified Saccharibacter]MXV36301.1 peptidylprolyl isomerase [Saccharibacter sp. EH611]MXV57161.1 peptidylprolyl isomerase [Saccharibacter sp. EH70]MXV66479.1 peptidylprolyl isomerase [Saccharibacter sp. EH60]
MITALRHFVVDTWIGRVIALAIFVAFIGLSGSFMGLSGGLGGMSPGDITQIGHYKITPRDFARSIQQRLGYLQQSGVPLSALRSPAAQQEVSFESLRDLLTLKGAQLAGERNGVTPSDELIRQTVFSMPEFRDAQGHFSADKMNQLLQSNGLQHQDLIEQVRQSKTAQATMFGLAQHVTVPKAELDQMVRFYTEARKVDLIQLPFSAGKVPSQPSDAQLKRFYDNHPWLFKEPEYRHARIVVLLPSKVEVTDDVVRAIYKQRTRDYNQPETRSVEVLGFDNEATAQKAAHSWQEGATWESIQKAFPQAIPATLPNARPEDLPDEALAKAAFSAHSGQVMAPVKTAMGWSVVHVTSITAPHQVSYEQAAPEIRAEVQKAEPSVVPSQHMQAFQEAVAGSTELDKIPADIGAVPVEGTLDAQGMTAEGSPAPLPGDEATRKAIVQQVFSQAKGDYPHVVSLPNGGGFAVVVENVQPGQQKAFDTVRADVTTAWQEEQQKRAQEARATALYQSAKKDGLQHALSGQPEEANLRKDERFSRLQKRSDMPELINRAALNQNVGQTAMLQEGSSFWLVQVTGSAAPATGEQEAVRQRVEQQLLQGLQGDLIESLGSSYQRETSHRALNTELFHQVSEQIFGRLVGGAGQGQ